MRVRTTHALEPQAGLPHAADAAAALAQENHIVPPWRKGRRNGQGPSATLARRDTRRDIWLVVHGRGGDASRPIWLSGSGRHREVKCPHGCRLTLQVSQWGDDATHPHVNVRCGSSAPTSLVLRANKPTDRACPGCERHLCIEVVGGPDHYIASNEVVADCTDSNAFMACLWPPDSDSNLGGLGEEEMRAANQILWATPSAAGPRSLLIVVVVSGLQILGSVASGSWYFWDANLSFGMIGGFTLAMSGHWGA